MPNEERVTIQKPYALAMVICDHVWRDGTTGKCTLLGSFSFIAAASFPATHHSMGIYAAITDGRGKVSITLTIVDADEEEALFRAEAEIGFEDPRAVSELVLNLQNITFPRPGEYRVQLFAGDEFLLERRLIVQQFEGKP